MAGSNYYTCVRERGSHVYSGAMAIGATESTEQFRLATVKK